MTGLVVVSELASACPPGGLFGTDCGSGRAFLVALLPLAAILYVGFLSLVVAWTARMAHHSTGGAGAGRDWYLVAAIIGLPLAPLLAFSILAGLGWLG